MTLGLHEAPHSSTSHTTTGNFLRQEPQMRGQQKKNNNKKIPSGLHWFKNKRKK